MAKIKTKNKGEEASEISKSKAKREERKKEVAKSRRQKRTVKIVGYTIAAAILLVIVFAIGKQIYLSAIRTTSSTDYSEGLTADGKINGVDAASVLNLVDFENISVPADEVKATAEEVDKEIESVLEQHKELSTDESLTIADGDVVNIDYVGTIDGVEFEGGNSNGAGYDLTIGSGSLIDDFEQQLIGHKPGEEITVEATFPEDYGDEAVDGKDAIFAVTIHGIQKTPELTDTFVAENLAETEEVSTAAEYRAKIEDKFYKEHLEDFLTNYIIENSSVTAYPKDYLKAVKAVTKHDDENMLSYYQQMFASSNMTAFENLWDLRDDSISDELKYELELNTRAKEATKEHLVYQAIFEKAGLTLDMEAHYAELTESNGEDYVTNMKETYGEGYMAQGQIREAVVDYLVGLYQ
ncbi:MAG: FKBP-type peptidyl-prolyl cis-trans isomerase [Lachnospiraceae bacterium]|nr:FKBP-type peptidyl-prolyl cis-trans isomerase [Lachnospiraceae bacterium]